MRLSDATLSNGSVSLFIYSLSMFFFRILPPRVRAEKGQGGVKELEEERKLSSLFVFLFLSRVLASSGAQQQQPSEIKKRENIFKRTNHVIQVFRFLSSNTYWIAAGSRPLLIKSFLNGYFHFVSKPADCEERVSFETGAPSLSFESTRRGGRSVPKSPRCSPPPPSSVGWFVEQMS